MPGPQAQRLRTEARTGDPYRDARHFENGSRVKDPAPIVLHP